MIKVVAFDVFGTVVDFSGVPREEKLNYLEQIIRREWAPLRLPKSWETLPAYSDSAQGIRMLRDNFLVVTCSNGPLGLQTKLLKNCRVEFDTIIPLEINRVYKKNPKAYLTICEVLDVAPEEVLMVTANEKFGDLEASRALGMQAALIRYDNKQRTIVDLANEMEAVK